MNTFFKNPANLLQSLVRFNTTNPPGNERECIAFIAGLLKEAGIETKIVYKVEGRPNLIARIKGRDACSPLLLYGHADVAQWPI